MMRLDGPGLRYLSCFVGIALCAILFGFSSARGGNAGATGAVGVEESAVARPPSADCRVAVIDGVALTVADVAALRAEIQPAPPWPRATRLAVDATLVHWWSTGDVAAPMQERLTSYGRTMREVQAGIAGLRPMAQEMRRLVQAAAAASGMELGDCYVGIEEEHHGTPE
jgi:hypothetical protein